MKEIPILRAFLDVIAEVNDEKRYIQKRQFEFALAELNEKQIVSLRKERDQTFIEMANAEKDILNVQQNDTNYFSLNEN